ncbi:hypothetical protein [uncultured Roseobacter sp.]|uniref:hypothetical protein n=1 Tax=uncultured Roseobacter sp. TaxID=114847 RepID=UPI00261F33C2|nr:hypothetical protein [uncultured Roseobacter sp.]
MSNIPADAAHWDSGDWIDWHRQATTTGNWTTEDPSDDPLARMHALKARMLQCAQSYFDLTGQHLPIYDAIGRIHGAIVLETPGLVQPSPEAGAQIVTIAPNAGHDTVTADMSKPFSCLIVVRIAPNFTSDARLLPRVALPDIGRTELRWRDLPNGR